MAFVVTSFGIIFALREGMLPRILQFAIFVGAMLPSLHAPELLTAPEKLAMAVMATVTVTVTVTVTDGS